MTNFRVRPTIGLLSLLVAATAGALLPAWAFGGAVATNVFTITCVPPTSAGSIELVFRFNQNPLGTKIDTTLTGTETAAQKASKIAASINNAAAPVSATVNGAAITVQPVPGGNLTDVWVGLDSTGEANQLGLVPANPASLISIVEFPTQNLSGVPSIGQLASMVYSDPNRIITGSTTSDGVKTASTLVNELNASTGLTWTPHTDPATFRFYYQSNYFDPTSADIQWNAFTGNSIANFGLDVPEPGSLSLAALMALSLTTSRRGRRAAPAPGFSKAR